MNAINFRKIIANDRYYLKRPDSSSAKVVPDDIVQVNTP